MEKVKRAVSQSGVSFGHIARELGISERTLKKKLKNNTVGIIEAESIAKMLGVSSPAELFFE